jgi:DNA-binding transcriptional MerR regulator
MPYKPKEITKLFYSIGEVAEMFDVNASLIRFWEKEFEILQPKKNKKGNRMFTPEDVENLKIIYHLVKERGFTLEGAKQKLKGNKEDTSKQYRNCRALRENKKLLTRIKKASLNNSPRQIVI